MALTRGAGAYLDTSLMSNKDNSRIRSAATNSMIRATPAVPATKYENTFKIEPDRTFPYAATRDAIKDILTTRLEHQKYDPNEVSNWSKELSETLRDKAKQLMDCKRYKVVAQVMIGEKDTAAIAVASRCLWNDKFDTRAESTYSNESLYAIGVVYGLYYE